MLQPQKNNNGALSASLLQPHRFLDGLRECSGATPASRDTLSAAAAGGARSIDNRRVSVGAVGGCRLGVTDSDSVGLGAGHTTTGDSGTRTATAFRRPRRPFSCPPRSRKLHNGGGRNSPLRRPALAGSPAPARPACALPMDSAQPAVAAPAPAPAAVAAAACAAIASPPVLVLVMVDGGQYVVIDPLVLRMHRTDR